MAYDPNNQPNRITGDLTNKVGGQLWIYISADDAATVAGSNYFSNAADIRMATGDLILAVDTVTPLLSGFLVHSVSSAGAVLGASGVPLGN